MDKDKSSIKRDLAWKYRILCGDECCIGVIGRDKRCRECGRAYEGELPPHFEEYVIEEGDESLPSEDDGFEAFEADNDSCDDRDEHLVTDDEWANRILCSDESCIGVIGPDGYCKDCGKPLKDAN